MLEKCFVIKTLHVLLVSSKHPPTHLFSLDQLLENCYLPTPTPSTFCSRLWKYTMHTQFFNIIILKNEKNVQAYNSDYNCRFQLEEKTYKMQETRFKFNWIWVVKFGKYLAFVNRVKQKCLTYRKNKSSSFNPFSTNSRLM